jgi:hypothetical protein
MYRCELHTILRETLQDITWTPSTKDEDNFRQVLSAALSRRASPYTVEIPSTRSGAGDIQVAGRRIEIKYASRSKQVALSKLVEDWDSMLCGETDFCIVSIRPERDPSDDHLDSCITPAVITPTAVPATLQRMSTGYCDIGMFLPAVSTELRQLSQAGAKGRPVFRYLPFEAAPAITRSCFLRTRDALLHVDTIGSREDGLISFLYKKAACAVIRDEAQLTWRDLRLGVDLKLLALMKTAPHAPLVARHAMVTVDVPTHKKVGSAPLLSLPTEADVSLFDLR